MVRLPGWYGILVDQPGTHEHTWVPGRQRGRVPAWHGVPEDWVWRLMHVLGSRVGQQGSRPAYSPARRVGWETHAIMGIEAVYCSGTRVWDVWVGRPLREYIEGNE